MKNKIASITVVIITIFLVSILTIAGTYAVVINVLRDNGVAQMTETLTIKDLLTNDDGTYNNTYYNVFNELAVTDEEANILMTSIPLNDALKEILNKMVDYRVNNNNASYVNNEEIYNAISLSVNKDQNINETLKNKVINKSSIYIQDVSDFLYGLNINIIS